jgi:tetratricopeptide (TPR) repeat protein
VRFAQAWLGHLAFIEGDWERAQALLEEAANNTAGSIQIQLYLQRDLAQLDVLMGRPEVAVTRLEQLIQGVESDNHNLSFLLPILAWGLLEIGEVEHAAAVVQGAVERGRRQEHALALVDALRIEGMVLARQGMIADAVQAFEEDVKLAQRMPYPFAEGRALYEWGTLEMVRGHHAEGRDRLTAALDIFKRLGAAKDVERVERVLSRAGS